MRVNDACLPLARGGVTRRGPKNNELVFVVRTLAVTEWIAIDLNKMNTDKMNSNLQGRIASSRQNRATRV